MAHAAKGDALLVAGRYREAIDSYERALMLAPSSILLGLPMAYNFIGEPEQAIAYADKAMRLSPHAPAAMWPTLYLAKAIAFGMLQDYEQALVWIERAEAAAPEIAAHGICAVCAACPGGSKRTRRAQQCSAIWRTTNAPIRTMSQWHARQSEDRCRPIIRLFLRVFLCREEIRRRPPKSRTAGVSNAVAHADEVIERAARCMSLMGRRAPNTARPAPAADEPLLPGRGRVRIVALSRVNAVFANDVR